MGKLKQIICGAILLCAPVSLSQNLLSNPSFETGDLTGWTIGTGTPAVAVDGTPSTFSPTQLIHPRTGQYAFFGGSIAQTVAVIPGQSYLAGFYALDLTNGISSASPSISIGGTSHVQILNYPASLTPAFTLVRQFYTAPAGVTSATVSFTPGGYSPDSDDFFFQPYTPPAITSGQTIHVLVSGDALPNHPGAIFGGGNIVPFINNAGDVIENVNTSLGSAYFINDGKTYKPVVIKGQPAPEGNGTLFPNGDPAMNSFGQVAFYASVDNTAGGTADDKGVYFYNGSSLTMLAREGQPLPDGNGTMQSAFPVRLNDQGKTCFAAMLSGTSGGSADNSALFLHDGNSLIKLARTGDTTPSGTAKYTAGQLFWNNFAMNNTGQVAFSADTKAISNGATSVALFLYDGATVNELAHSGLTTDSQAWSNPGHVDLTDSGQIIFDAKIASTSGILLRNNNNTYKVLAQLTTPAPDGNGTFSAFSESATASNSAQVAFRAALTGGNTDNSGIYRAGTEGIIKIARSGQLTPENDGNFSVFDPNPSISSTGIVAFVSQNSNANNDSEVGIYVGDGRDTLLVARFGYQVDGAIIDTASVINRVPTSINANGQVAYRRVMSDGLTRILRWTPTLHWRSTTSGDWSNSDNWTLGLEPAGPHPVVIDPAIAATITGPTHATTIQSLEVGGSAATRLALGPASTLTVTADAKFNRTATLAMQLGQDPGQEPSHLAIGQNAAFSGTLDLTTAPDFAPKLGDTEDIITYASHTSRFDTIVGISTGNKLALAVTYLPDRLRLTAALPGDADLDQAVGFPDLVAVAQHYGLQDQDWSTGDFTGDGAVDFQDLVIIAQNYGAPFPSAAIPGATPQFNHDLGAASVPEPGIGLGLISILLLRPRHRKGCHV